VSNKGDYLLKEFALSWLEFQGVTFEMVKDSSQSVAMLVKRLGKDKDIVEIDFERYHT